MSGCRSRALRLIPAVAVLGVMLAGCTAAAPAGTPTSAPSPSRTMTAAPTGTSPSSPGDLVVSLDRLELQDDEGDALGGAPFSDGAGTVAFVGDLLGNVPTGIPNPSGYPIVSYDWGELTLSVVDEGPATLWVSAGAANGLEIRTTEGVGVGATRDEALAAGAVEGADEDGDGLADLLRLQVREAEGTESLEDPGRTGSDFILLLLEGDVIARLIVPANDYGDL